MIVKKILVEIYNYDIIFCFNDDHTNVEKIEELLSKYKIDTTNIEKWIDDARGWTFSGWNESVIVLNLENIKDQNDLITTLRHEVHHASAEIFKYIHSTVKELDEESFLYLNDWIFEKGLELIDKNSIIIKKEDKKNGKKK